MTKVNVVSAAIEPRLQLMLVANGAIAKGEIIFACSSEEITRERTWRTIQIDFNRHVKNDLLDYVDHSCEPNSVFDVDRLALISLRKIENNESITFFYPGAEVELAIDFDCQCGSRDCIGHLKGGFYLTGSQMRWAIDRGYCTRFMQQQFRRLLELHEQA
ncbi:MAG: SET domain-containing protein-lysine N-methyltransferase [Gammaproteobacteria bacterium]